MKENIFAILRKQYRFSFYYLIHKETFQKHLLILNINNKTKYRSYSSYMLPLHESISKNKN